MIPEKMLETLQCGDVLRNTLVFCLLRSCIWAPELCGFIDEEHRWSAARRHRLLTVSNVA